MELAVNYSEEVKELFKEGKIDFVDYFKLFSIDGNLEPFDWCASNKKVLFHGLIGNGSDIVRKDFLEGRDFDLQQKYFDKSRIPHISMHISLNHEEIYGSDDELIDTIKSNVNEIKKRFNYEVLLENMPLGPRSKKYQVLTNANFINRVIKECNTYFLLDIAHARAAAYIMDIPFMDYINSLPLEKVRELHLSGCVKDENGIIVPNHSKMNDEDYELVRYLINKCPNLKVVTLEYSPYEIHSGNSLLNYTSVNPIYKEEVYNNLIKIKEIINK